MLMNNRRADSLDRYYESGGVKPKNGQIIFAFGSKGEDIIFAHNLMILDEKIYTRLADLK